MIRELLEKATEQWRAALMAYNCATMRREQGQWARDYAPILLDLLPGLLAVVNAAEKVSLRISKSMAPYSGDVLENLEAALAALREKMKEGK